MADEARVILARIEAQLGEQTRALVVATGKLESMDDMLRGDHDTDGIIVRIDRIEQREKTRTKVLWLTFGAAMTALGAWVKKLVTG